MALSLLKKALIKLKRQSNVSAPESLVSYLKETYPLLKEKTTRLMIGFLLSSWMVVSLKWITRQRALF